MQLIKERGDVIRFFLEKDESCSVVLYSLKDFDRRIRKTDEKRVTVVNAGQNKTHTHTQNHHGWQSQSESTFKGLTEQVCFRCVMCND